MDMHVVTRDGERWLRASGWSSRRRRHGEEILGERVAVSEERCEEGRGPQLIVAGAGTGRCRREATGALMTCRPPLIGRRHE